MNDGLLWRASGLRLALLLVAGSGGAALRAADATAGDAWSLHAQSTAIEQWHGGFTSPYSGQESLEPRRQDKHTITLTFFLGRRLWAGGEFYYNPEITQGTGLSDTVGVAGFPNGEATRAGAKTPEYNTARLFVRQTFALGGATEKIESDQNQLAGARATERVTLTVGKLSAADMFDTNTYSHDPRTQFLNWALMSNGAWDYPADVKGYTAGCAVEWTRATRTLRYGAFLEPKEANGRPLDHHVRDALGQIFEWEERYTIGGHAGALRPFVYGNRAHMGSYAGAARFAVPDVTLTRRYRAKAGAGLNWEQELAKDIGVFARGGFNDGRNETWAFTEIDRTLSAGVSVKGVRWDRAADTFGAALLANGLSGDHRRYLAAGGYGFIAGDGRLAYAPEEILETYYDWKPVTWLALAADYQWVGHPAYNRARGPVSIFAVRAHVAF